MARTDPPRLREGSQSRIPSILFWILAAAVVFRLVTALTHRGQAEKTAGLVRWQSPEMAAAVATRQGRPLLYDFTAAWCVPCHRLDEEGWTDSKIAGMVNDGLLPVRVVDRQREDGKNTPLVDDLQRRYSINAFPTLIVAEASGKEIARAEGYGGKARLAQFLEEARKKAGK
ncbi:MAG TPA: thioredoxin family protein [Thermoanaerobaculia bacterium]|nr:thioredoxin family protein [Thermoanaerobaculia bacterium]